METISTEGKDPSEVETKLELLEALRASPNLSK